MERNPFPFFPFNPRWRTEMTAAEFQTFCVMLRLAWVSPRPCMLPADPEALNRVVEGHVRCPIPGKVLARFKRHERLGFLYFPPQLRALQRLVNGEDLYSLLWDESL